VVDETFLTKIFTLSYCIRFSGDVPTNSVDISSLFRVGVNTITFLFKDASGGSDATWAMWLTLP
jgi:hypothetical protein